MASQDPPISSNPEQNQAQPQAPAAQPQAPPVAAGINDTFQCQWQGCGERASSAESLYEHVCDRHIGRKSTNNLNLQCAWGNCHVAVVKRDHITSHIRVHVPLKPHRCEFCGKAFKRPQDLKKHVKTHADDSVIVGNQGSRPGPGGNQVNGQANGYGPGKPPANYFPDQQMHSGLPMNYGSQGPNGNGHSAYYNGPTPQSAYHYGNVNYAAGNPSHDLTTQASLESIKNGLEILRRLFPDHQRGSFDPRSYQQVESRIAALQSLNLPFLSQQLHAPPQPIGVSGGHEDPYASHYSLPPMDNLRTKNDLVNLDQLFATMQSTIYENPTEIAAAGVGQPGAHYVPMNYQSQHSPTGLHPPSSHGVSAPTPSSHHSGTPALTPPSSAVSNTSGNSPPALHLSGLSPTTPAGMYPTLPGQPATQGYVPAMGSQFDHDSRRRYSGGRLQKAAPASLSRSTKPEDAMDTSSDGGATPKAGPQTGASSEAGSPKPSSRRGSKFSSSNLDPALGGSTSPTDGEIPEATVKANEAWVSTAKCIEALRAWVNHRLSNRIYEEDTEMDQDQDQKNATPKEEKEVSYPTLTQTEAE